MELLDKLAILADAAKYDAACTSSGVRRGSRPGMIGNTSSSLAGCCHSFSADGRCITLLKVLMTNRCVYDCKYCVNRRSHDTRRAAFTPRELAELTIGFYRRNYIEGLFLSSGVLRSPDYTTEQMIECLRLLRQEYRFNGYIHAKAIPGTSPELVQQLGLLADRLSVNIELPSQEGLQTLAPDKNKQAILRPMGLIRDRAAQSKAELVQYKHAPVFAPAGQSTQLIVGATRDTDRHILHLTESLYRKYRLKRVFYSAYVPVVENALLPSLDTKPPLLREHRLYQADWLLRFYGFKAQELLDEAHPDFNPCWTPSAIGPCATWSSSRWRSVRRTWRLCCGCRASAGQCTAHRLRPSADSSAAGGPAQAGRGAEAGAVPRPACGGVCARGFTSLPPPCHASWRPWSGASCRPRNAGSCRCSMPGDAMEDVIFQYDGSFPGFLCCVFDSYAHKEFPIAFTAMRNASPCIRCGWWLPAGTIASGCTTVCSACPLRL